MRPCSLFLPRSSFERQMLKKRNCRKSYRENVSGNVRLYGEPAQQQRRQLRGTCCVLTKAHLGAMKWPSPQRGCRPALSLALQAQVPRPPSPEMEKEHNALGAQTHTGISGEKGTRRKRRQVPLEGGGCVRNGKAYPLVIQSKVPENWWPFFFFSAVVLRIQH